MTKQPTMARISKYFESLGITNINAVMEACREFQRGRDSAMLDIKEQYLDPIREILDQGLSPYSAIDKIEQLLIECEEEYYDGWE